MQLVKCEVGLQLAGSSRIYATYQKVIFYLAKYAEDPLFYFAFKITKYVLFVRNQTPFKSLLNITRLKGVMLR